MRSSNVHHYVSAGTTNATSIVTGATTVTGYEVGNASNAPKYVKLFNKASAPTVGTDVPVLTILVPANSASHISLTESLFFSLGLGMSITGALADLDNTGVSAADVVVNLFTKI